MAALEKIMLNNSYLTSVSVDVERSPSLSSRDIAEHWDEIQKQLISIEKDREEFKLRERQFHNNRLRTLVKNVIFNGNTTIVFWDDGTKTISKCAENEPFDKEKGILTCMARKLYDGSGIYNEVLRKYVKE